MRGMVDFHLHFSPDDRPRKLDAAAVLESYAEAGAKGLVYKSHQLGTAVAARVLDASQSRVRVAGGVALNHGVGGLNPAAVEASARSGGRIVWMPTHDARELGRVALRSTNSLDDHDLERLRRECLPILELCAEYDQVLCSGHLEPPVVAEVFAWAQERGVQKRVVNHPDHFDIRMTLDLQRRLAATGAFLERVIPRSANSNSDLASLVVEMTHVGMSQNVLGSDLGQLSSPDPAPSFAEFISDLAANGMGERDLMQVAEGNASMLLGWS